MKATELTKQDLRSEFLNLRRQIKGEEKARIDALICEHFLLTDYYRRAKKIFMYSPFGSEIDVTLIAKRAMQEGKEVAYPICNTENSTMTFHTVTSFNQLQKGAYSIYEPSSGNSLAISDENTVCLVPALAFNPQGYRIGYGKGYYDRFLKDFNGISVGLVYKRFVSDRIVIGEYDLPCDVLISEEGVFFSEYEQ